MQTIGKNIVKDACEIEARWAALILDSNATIVCGATLVTNSHLITSRECLVRHLKQNNGAYSVTMMYSDTKINVEFFAYSYSHELALVQLVENFSDLNGETKPPKWGEHRISPERQQVPEQKGVRHHDTAHTPDKAEHQNVAKAMSSQMVFLKPQGYYIKLGGVCQDYEDGVCETVDMIQVEIEFGIFDSFAERSYGDFAIIQLKKNLDGQLFEDNKIKVACLQTKKKRY
uniref:Peptidase S1 domain-containing protein n=1 Tax=Ditylenchus dipsaci TaxID=166011 RepID=A0A915CSJ8_9BILA